MKSNYLTRASLARVLAFAILLLPLLGPLRWFVTVLAVLTVAINPKFRWRVLMLASIVMWFDRFRFMPFAVSTQDHASPIPIFSFAVALALAYALAYLCLLAARHRRVALVLPFLVYFAILACADHFCSQPTIFRLLKPLSLVFNGLLWPLAVTALMPKIFSRFSRAQVATLLIPFWQTFVTLPIPIGPTFLLTHEAHDEAMAAEVQKKGLKLLVWSLILLVTTRALEHWAFGWPFLIRGTFQDLSHYYNGGTYDAFLALHGSSRLVMGGAILTVLLRYFLAVASDVGISVAMARFMGFNLAKMVDRPYAATSFGNLYGRLLYYYNQLLMKTWFLLFWRILPRNTPEKVKLGAGVLLSVWLGGYMFHLLRDLATSVGTVPLAQVLSFYFKLAPYYFVIGLTSALSALNRHRQVPLSKITLAAKSAVYFIFYAIIYSLNSFVNHDFKSWNQIGQIWFGILGF